MKKLNKFFAILVALAMMATLCVSMAFAVEDTAAGSETSADGKQSADALISKYLKVNDGTSVPDATFTFTFTAKDSDTTSATDTPAINPYQFKTKGNDANMSGTAATNDGNAVAGVVRIADLVTNNDALIFSAPGEYIYEVQETAGTLVQDEDTQTTETLTNDTTTKYTIRIYVKRGAGNTLVIDTITIAAPDGSKLDPTENPVTDTQFDPDSASANDGATIVNNYEKKKTIPENELTEDNAMLALKKVVSAADGYVNPNQEFPFVLTLTKPEDATAASDAIVAYKINGSTKTLVSPALTYGENNVSLKAGEVLAFSELPYGAKYTVSEDLDAATVENSAAFTPKYDWIDVEAPATTVTGTKGADLALNGIGTVADTDTANKVTYTNTFDSEGTTPTGILISNLPYIALALVAIGGLVAYVVVRRRQDDEA